MTARIAQLNDTVFSGDSQRDVTDDSDTVSEARHVVTIEIKPRPLSLYLPDLLLYHHVFLLRCGAG